MDKNTQLSTIVRRSAIGLGIFAVALLVFALGAAVGSRSARFDERYWSPDDRAGISGMLPELPGGHGAAGKVVSVSGSGFVIAEAGANEKVVLVDASTTIRRFRGAASTTDVQVGDSVIVLGTPNPAGQINADLVRIIPATSAAQ